MLEIFGRRTTWNVSVHAGKQSFTRILLCAPAKYHMLVCKQNYLESDSVRLDKAKIVTQNFRHRHPSVPD